jgi:predicted MFS family arabinose efflux permease
VNPASDSDARDAPGAAGEAGTRHWLAIAIAGGAGMLVVMGLGRFSFTAMVPALIDSRVLTATEAGWVGSANLAGYLVGALGAERVRTRFGQRRLLALALGAAVALLFLSALPFGFLWLAGCRGLIGVTTSLVMIQSLAAIGASAPANRRALAAGALFAGVGLGILCAGQLVPLLAGLSLTNAWLAVAGAGALAMLAAFAGWRRIVEPAAPAPTEINAWWPSDTALIRVVLAHGLFSFALVPHTLYWVDTIARVQGYGLHLGGLHWSAVGVFSVLGPLLLARFAGAIGTAPALSLSFAGLAIGVGAPALSAATGILVASSVLFGMQPGVAALMAARARDLSSATAMPQVMRAMMLANAIGGTAGGMLVPYVHATAGPFTGFAIAGAALACATLAVTLPTRRRS